MHEITTNNVKQMFIFVYITIPRKHSVVNSIIEKKLHYNESKKASRPSQMSLYVRSNLPVYQGSAISRLMPV